jgi:hypothetical protein
LHENTALKSDLIADQNAVISQVPGELAAFGNGLCEGTAIEMFSFTLSFILGTSEFYFSLSFPCKHILSACVLFKIIAK